MKKFIIVIIAVLMFGFAEAQNTRDTLFFSNGSRVIGEIDKIKLGVISFDPDDANDITVKLIKVNTFSATSKVFRIETIDKKVYFGKVRPSGAGNACLVIQGGDTTALDLGNISLMYPYRNEFVQRFSGSVGLGFSYTRASDFGQANGNIKVSYVARNDELSLAASAIASITDSTFTRDREDVSLKDNHYFSTTWFGTLMFSYQRNLELGLERRFQEGLGAGNKFVTSKHVYAWVRTGFVLNQERNTNQVNSGTLTEAFVQLAFNYFQFTKPEINLVIFENFYYNLTQKDRIRNDSEVDWTWEIIKDLNLNLNIYTNYDSKPPNSDSKQFDFSIVFGLSYSF